MNTQSLVALALSLACLADCESKYEVNEKNCEPKNFRSCRTIEAA